MVNQSSAEESPGNSNPEKTDVIREIMANQRKTQEEKTDKIREILEKSP